MAPADSAFWRFSFTPYLWAASQKGQVGVGGSVSEVDLSFGDIVQEVQIGFSAVLEARYARWIGALDFQFFNLNDDVPVAEGSADSITTSLDQVIAQPQVGYTLLVRPWGGLDGLVGVRYWHLSVDIGVTHQDPSRSGSKAWVDGTVGARLRYSPGPKGHLVAKGDVGGGGSKFTWQAMGGGGYDLGHCCAVLAAYRHLDVDYESDGFTDDVYMTGPALGLEIRF